MPCKKYLLKWNNPDSNNGLCTLCNIPEDYSHLFCSCQRVQDFLEDVQNVMENKLKICVNLKNISSLIFGYKQRYNTYNDINYLIVIVYYTIFKYYCLNDANRINMYMLKYELKIRNVNML